MLSCDGASTEGYSYIASECIHDAKLQERQQGKFCYLACGAFALQLLESAMEQDISCPRFSAGKGFAHAATLLYSQKF